MIKCKNCHNYSPEKEIELSHDVPCYLFEGVSRNIRKNQADKYGRRYLCNPCHKAYEKWLRLMLRGVAETFAKVYFKEGDNETRMD